MDAAMRRDGIITIGAITPNEKYHRAFDFSVTYATVCDRISNILRVTINQNNVFLQSDTTCAVHKYNILPHSIGMIRVFQPFVWLASVILCGYVCFVIWGMAKIAIGEFSSYTKASNITLTTIRILLGNVPPFSPRTNLIRVVFFLWSIFCMNLSSAYSSSLFSMITNPFRPNTVIS